MSVYWFFLKAMARARFLVLIFASSFLLFCDFFFFDVDDVELRIIFLVKSFWLMLFSFLFLMFYNCSARCSGVFFVFRFKDSRADLIVLMLSVFFMFFKDLNVERFIVFDLRVFLFMVCMLLFFYFGYSFFFYRRLNFFAFCVNVLWMNCRGIVCLWNDCKYVNNVFK